MRYKADLDDGITLIEIMLICIILAIVSSIFVSIYVFKSPVLHKMNQTTRNVLTIKNALEFYKLDNGFYPSTAQGLSALVTKPVIEPIPKHWRHYLKTIPTDPLGKPFHYVNPGKHKAMDVYSDE